MKKLLSSIILALVPMALGILILLFPSRTITIVMFMIALFMLIAALKELYTLLSFDALSPRIRNVGIAKNSINIILAVLVMFFAFSNPESLMNIIVYLIAIDLLLTALSDILDYVMLHRLGFNDIPFIDTVLKIALSILMFFFPSFISSTFIKIVAIILIVLSVAYLLISIFIYRNQKEEEIVVEYEEKD